MSVQGTVLRPVQLSPEEAALAYMAVLSMSVPGERVKDAARILAKVEAAMVELKDEVKVEEERGSG